VARRRSAAGRDAGHDPAPPGRALGVERLTVTGTCALTDHRERRRALAGG
jgi:hypothetical protein